MLIGMHTAVAHADTQHYSTYSGVACKPLNPNAPHSYGYTHVRNTGTRDEYFVCPAATRYTYDGGVCNPTSGQCSGGSGFLINRIMGVFVTARDTQQRYTRCYVRIFNARDQRGDWYNGNVSWGQFGLARYMGQAFISVPSDHIRNAHNIVVTCKLKPGQEIHDYTIRAASGQQ